MVSPYSTGAFAAVNSSQSLVGALGPISVLNTIGCCEFKTVLFVTFSVKSPALSSTAWLPEFGTPPSACENGLAVNTIPPASLLPERIPAM